MSEISVSQEDRPSPADLAAINDWIVDYNLAQVGDHWKGRLTILARDAEGNSWAACWALRIAAGRESRSWSSQSTLGTRALAHGCSMRLNSKCSNVSVMTPCWLRRPSSRPLYESKPAKPS